MKIDRHISELLFDHDCVIVPAFGGFLASYQPSQFQSLQHTFYPPSKKIAFNILLKNNDGLLANYIADSNDMSYSEALKNIERFRIETIDLLDSGKRITIEDVGTLFYDSQKNLQFEPVKHINYLEEAFGLTAVQLSPVKRDVQRKNIERQIREAVSIRSSEKPPRVRLHGKLTARKTFARMALVSGALLWFAYNIYLITPDHKQNTSSFNPLSYSPEPAKVEAPVAAAKPEPAPEVAPSEQVQQQADSIDRLLPDKQLSNTNNLPLVAAMTPPKAGKTELETIIQSQKNYFIIAGVFREPGNAEKLVASLREQGFNKAEIVNPEGAVKKVCYSSFVYRRDAVAALEQLHAAKKDGWILEK